MKSEFISACGENQHAFRPLGSTTSALIAIHDSLTSFMKSPLTTCVKVTSLDFSEAFDKIPHDRLLHILHLMGFSHGLLLWPHSYLTDRYQRIMFNGNAGPLTQVLSGVPQGFALFMSTQWPGSKFQILYLDAKNHQDIR